jgi:hypothetical protein
MSIDGLALTPDPEDGSWGETLVSGPAGSQVEVTPRTAVNGAIFGGDEIGGMAAQQVHLAIIDTNSGTDLTLQTNSVIVGQQMNWQCRLSMTNSFMTNFPLANFKWTIPGYAISNYVANDSSGIVYTNFSTVNSNVVFCWVDGVTNLADATNRVVQCSATVNGKTVTGQATFKVVKPMTTIAPWTSSVNVNSSQLGLGLALVFADSTGYGIIFSNTMTVPSGFSGTNEWIQVITSGPVDNLQDAGLTNHVWTENGSSPYGDNPIPYAAFYGPNPFDAPALQLTNGYVRAAASGSFEMTMMFQPAGGIPVPLRTVNWTWGGSATNGPGGWQLESGSNGVPTVFDTETYPTWKSATTNAQFIPPLP